MSTQPEKKENKLNELYEQGKAKGTMTYDEIITKLSTTDIDPDQFDTVLETLEAMGVEVIRDANSAEGRSRNRRYRSFHARGHQH